MNEAPKVGETVTATTLSTEDGSDDDTLRYGKREWYVDLEIVANLAREARDAVIERDDAIRDMRAKGASLRSIGEAAGLSHTAVRLICERGADGEG